ncbi:MAG TPA: N-acetyltransferase [Anaerolineae bacterium]|nr:N-acetyltransferase [Anaerolineae bacterium]HNU04644.1 N-acetyltransferase [Anaerolineae bacterium]
MSIVIRPITEADAPAISDLVSGFAAQNLMLPRSQAQVLLALEDFLVADEAGRVVGCGSLIELTPTLAEVRSLAVAADVHGRGVGGQIVGALLDMARQRELDQVCALTLRPNFFQRQGFQIVDRWNLTPKIWSECVYCTKFHRCDEVAMLMNLHDPAAAPNPMPWWRYLADHAPQPVLRWLAPRRA